MERNTLKGQRAERDSRRKETAEAVKQLTKTEVNVVRVAEQVGSIHSELTDIQSQIREKRNRVLDSAQKAGSADGAAVQAQEQKTGRKRKEVEATEHRTAAEQQKAERIRPGDRRITDGGELSKVLRAAGTELKSISRDLRSVEVGAQEKRAKASRQIDAAVRKNRK